MERGGVTLPQTFDEANRLVQCVVNLNKDNGRPSRKPLSSTPDFPTESPLPRKPGQLTPKYAF